MYDDLMKLTTSEGTTNEGGRASRRTMYVLCTTQIKRKLDGFILVP